MRTSVRTIKMPELPAGFAWKGVLAPMLWKGLDSLAAIDIWTDGANIYYSTCQEPTGTNPKHYVLNGHTWEKKTWKGVDKFSGRNIWSDGTNIYCSEKQRYYGVWENYKLNGDTWERVTEVWGEFLGNTVWTDGTKIYRSDGAYQRVFNGSTWDEMIWSGGDFTDTSSTLSAMFRPDKIWTDGSNIYFSPTSMQYVLNKTNNTWETKTWGGTPPTSGRLVWHDGTNIRWDYCWRLTGNNWELDTNSQANYAFGSAHIWCDGKNLYHSGGDANSILLPTSAKLYHKAYLEWRESPINNFGY